MSLLIALLLAQVGPAVTSNPQPVSALPPELRDRPKPRAAAKDAAAPAEPGELEACLGLESPVDAVDAANDWLTRAKGTERATAGECLGVALSRLERWDEAAQAFAAARGAADTAPWRARLGAMTGEAALNAGDAQAALDALDKAKTDAGGDTVMQGGLALFRARALVALKRDAAAAEALADARRLAPDSAQAWLLSATLSRRQGKLSEAQQQIERAFDLRPVDLQIGLEAGVIAVLSGRDDAARKSWQSVIAAAPDSAEATVARGYIAQLDPAAPAETGR
jgi:tetratricopeptide (TPR) repeat protein